MALHYVDKNNSDRSSPSVNSHDEQDVLRMAHGTNSVNYTTDATPASTGPAILGGNARLVASGTAKIILSYNSGVLNLGTTTIPHNLGYAPLAIVALNNAQINGVGSSNIFLPTWTSAAYNTANSTPFINISQYMAYSTDTTNLYITTLTAGIISGGADTFLVTYYLYQQTVI